MIDEYLCSINSLADSLSFAGKPITAQEHVDVILGGLPEEYDPLVIAIETRTEPYTVAEIEAILFVCESRLNLRRNDIFCDAVSVSTQQPSSFDHSIATAGFLAPPGFTGFGGHRAPLVPSVGGRFGNIRTQGRGGGGRFGWPRAGPTGGRPYPLVVQPSSSSQSSLNEHEYPWVPPPPPRPPPPQPFGDSNPSRAVLGTYGVNNDQQLWDSGSAGAVFPDPPDILPR